MSSASMASPAAAGGPSVEEREETTLDEPVSATLKREFQQIADKMWKVAMPGSDSKTELRNWDLWGPLFLCLFLAILLSIDETGSASSHKDADRPAVVFSSMLLMVWIGAIVVTVNAKLLGGNVSFFQNICLLGYCVAPMIVATALCMTIRLTIPDASFTCGAGPKTVCLPSGACVDSSNSTVNVGASCGGWGDKESCVGDGRCSQVHIGYTNVLLRLLFSVAAVFWSLRSSLGFLSEVVTPERRALAAYPVCLFFTAIGWMVMLRTSSS
mmetsp:Transcript_35589/g.84658  ORF Transcript_35589/g.84658 Transcript_35589/m.84658 type:complete len:270 (+) Transcript_35589:93-902(+)